MKGRLKVLFHYKDKADRFHPQWVPVSHALPSADGAPVFAQLAGGGGGVAGKLWVALVEKAFALWRGKASGYEKIGEGGWSNEALEQLTGQPATSRILGEDPREVEEELRAALAEHRAVVAWGNNSTYKDAAGVERSHFTEGLERAVAARRLPTNTLSASHERERLYARHAYAVTGIERRGGVTFVKLFHPQTSRYEGQGAPMFELPLRRFIVFFGGLAVSAPLGELGDGPQR